LLQPRGLAPTAAQSANPRPRPRRYPESESRDPKAVGRRFREFINNPEAVRQLVRRLVDAEDEVNEEDDVEPVNSGDGGPTNGSDGGAGRDSSEIS
jgi:hypothetical protein